MYIGRLVLITGSSREYFNKDSYISIDYDTVFTDKFLQYLYLNRIYDKIFVLRSKDIDLQYYPKLKSIIYSTDADISPILTNLIPSTKVIIDISTRFVFTFNRISKNIFYDEKEFYEQIATIKRSIPSIDILKNRKEGTKYIKYITSNLSTEFDLLQLADMVLRELNCDRVIIRSQNNNESTYYMTRPDRTFLKFENPFETIEKIYLDINKK